MREDLVAWIPMDQAPSNYVPSEVRRFFDGGEDEPDFDLTGEFDSASMHWYQTETGASYACVVFDSSTFVNAAFSLSADTTQTDPIDLRIMGTPFARHPFFWEGCADEG